MGLINDILNNKFNMNEIKNLYKMINNTNIKHMIKKVIIYKYIYKLYLETDNKFDFLLDFITKMKNKTNDNNEYNSNIRLIYKIFKLDKIELKKLKKELFKLKPISEQNYIREKNNIRNKMRFALMTDIERKHFYKLKKEIKIKKIGYNNYLAILRNRYHKWYNGLSPLKKLKLKNNRNLKYKNMEFEAKQKLLMRHRLYYKNKK
jgi:hypothetical protein